MTQSSDDESGQNRAEKSKFSASKPDRDDLPAAARRALAEAEERRAQNLASENTDKPAEEGGPKGAEPTRYGDWERNGRAVDF